MKRFFDKELETFRADLNRMGDLAIRLVGDAMKALVAGDTALAKQVIGSDDEIDDLEKKIDNEAVRYINLRSPVATELRLVITGMKACHDLERIGDEATSIAKRTIRIAEERPFENFDDLSKMASITLEMLQDALHCFDHADREKAVAVVTRDAEVDLLNKKIRQDLSLALAKDPSNSTRDLELIFISKSLERIGDHACNIAEEMVFLYDATDIRHDASLKKAPKVT
jgi:phosphate transport system protein